MRNFLILLSFSVLSGCIAEPPDCPFHDGCSCCINRTMLGGCEVWHCQSCGTYCELGFHRLVEDDGGADAAHDVCDGGPVDASSDAVCEAGMPQDGGLILEVDAALVVEEPVASPMMQ